MGLREIIRERAHATANIKTKTVRVLMGDVETDVLIKQPSLKVRRVLAEIGRIGKSATPDLNAATAMKIEAVLECTVDEKGEPVFTAIDRSWMEKDVAAGGWVDVLADHILDFMRGSVHATCSGTKPEGGTCGTELPLGANFCPSCGTKTETPAEVALGNSAPTPSARSS